MLPLHDPDAAQVEGQIWMAGIHALPLVGADLKASKESINYDIIRSIADENRIIGWKIGDYNLTSRIVHDLNFQFNYTEKHTKIKTTTGNAFVIRTNNLIDRLLTKTNDRITDLSLELPSTYRHELLLSKTSLVGKISNCSIDSPWIQGTRTVTNEAEGIRILDELVIKKDKIPNAELKTKEYTEFQEKVYACFGDTALVYNNQNEAQNTPNQ